MIHALDRMAGRRTNWLLEADVTDFFPSIDRAMLMEMLQHRVADTSLLRLIGVFASGCWTARVHDAGRTAQGSVISPMLGNIYLHYA